MARSGRAGDPDLLNEPGATPPKRPRRSTKAAEPAAPPARRRVWITGGAGFIGAAVVRELVEHGDEVTAVVRDRSRAPHLADLGVTVIEDDLSDVRRLTESLRDMGAAIHAAGMYRVGIARSERGAMWDANIGTTTRVLDAAEAAGVPRLVYVSTVNVFGNTHGEVVDETHRRDLAQGFLSWYDETKFGADEVVAQRIRGGAPVVIVMPSQVYGPGDHSEVGEQLRLAYEGTLRYRTLDDVGLAMVHVDDLAAGIVAALDRGIAGQRYVLAGPRLRLREAVTLAAEIGGKRPPVVAIPAGVLRVLRPVGRLVGQANLGEVISASAGVTYWASSDKATAELGFAPRPFEEGLGETLTGRSGDAAPSAAASTAEP